MIVDKNNIEIKLGYKITNGYNGGNRLPLDLFNLELKKFKVVI